MGIVSGGGTGGGSGALTQIADSLLSGAGASFDFTGIAATYTSLTCILYCRGDVAATTTPVLLRFNNDSGTNYDWELLNAAAAAASAGEGIGATSVQIADAVGSTGPANAFTSSIITVPQYAGTTGQKCAYSYGGDKTTVLSGGTFVRVYSGFWRSTLAISRITLLPTTGNFVAGSRATLYGLT